VAASLLRGVVAVALAGLVGLGRADGDTSPPAARSDSGTEPAAARAAAGQKVWVCPMHPHVVRDHPGTCPICGMDLVETEFDHLEHQPGGIHLDAATVQRLGVRLAAAARQALSREIHAFGRAAIDSAREYRVTSKIEGTIRRLEVSSPGQYVKAGQVLYEIDSPELLQTQREYIALLREKDEMVAKMTRGESHSATRGMPREDRDALAKSTAERMRARDRLLYADAGEELVEQIDRSYRVVEVVPVRAARSGFVTQIQVREGSVVKPMDVLFTLADLSRLRIEVPLFPDQLAWVKSGDRASIRLPPPDRAELGGTIEAIEPVLDDVTSTARARITVANPGMHLPVGSFVDVTIHAQTHQAIAIPRSAVLRSGKGDFVMRALGAGHFAPSKVAIGIESDDWTEIMAGLQVGDQVAVNGQFLLDSAASLSDAAERMSHGGPAEPAESRSMH